MVEEGGQVEVARGKGGERLAGVEEVAGGITTCFPGCG